MPPETKLEIVYDSSSPLADAAALLVWKHLLPGLRPAQQSNSATYTTFIKLASAILTYKQGFGQGFPIGQGQHISHQLGSMVSTF